eukprot:SM000139S00129  [mRNA]  locus=s139:362541:364863:+ [translate_table: standard]
MSAATSLAAALADSVHRLNNAAAEISAALDTLARVTAALAELDASRPPPREAEWRAPARAPPGRAAVQVAVKSADTTLAALSTAEARGEDVVLLGAGPSLEQQEANAKGHKFAFKLQRAFVQARIEGLGKPPEVALEEFVDICMEAYSADIGQRALQLQLLLAEGSLIGPFSRTEAGPSDHSLSEVGQLFSTPTFGHHKIPCSESRIRSSWISLVYSTLRQVKPHTEGAEGGDQISEGDKDTDVSMDDFVNQVRSLERNSGINLRHVREQQAVNGPPMSPSIKMMRQSQMIVLMTLDKYRHKTY